ncbi:MAG TPA: GspH/FimT family pseudopilin [Usitatibacteraceae bacterium]|nr:GspH/FimT family pseudopilin [Usitatibacteraceae bacterium]
MRRAAQSGMSLIEILVAIAIVGILFALGMPSYGTWIQNTQIRTAAESILAGLQVAKNEAIRRNAPMQFKLDAGTTTQWRVNPFIDPDGTPIQSRAAEEGSPNATITLTPADANTVTFSALGRVIPNADASPSLTRVDVDNPQIAVVADRRNLALLLPPGGSIRLCDPKAPANDPRTCQVLTP